MNPSPTELLAAPELAVLRVLGATLDATTAALLAAHLDVLDPNNPRPHSDEPVRAAAIVARTLLDLQRMLRVQIDAYHDAIETDQARQRRDETYPF